MSSLKLLVYLLPLVLGSCAAPTLISKRGSDVHWTGSFSSGAAEKFRRQIGPETRRVIIKSPGGLADEFLEVARLVQKHGLSVQVKDYCISSCAFLFVAAPRRELPDDAFLVFHASMEEVALREAHREAAELMKSSSAKILQPLDKVRDDLRVIFKNAGVYESLYDKLVPLAGVIPGSVKVSSAEFATSDRATVKFNLRKCGVEGWVPDEEGLRRIGVSLTQPYVRPPKERIVRVLNVSVEQLAFGPIDDLTVVTCSKSDGVEK